MSIIFCTPVSIVLGPFFSTYEIPDLIRKTIIVDQFLSDAQTGETSCKKFIFIPGSCIFKV